MLPDNDGIQQQIVNTSGVPREITLTKAKTTEYPWGVPLLNTMEYTQSGSNSLSGLSRGAPAEMGTIGEQQLKQTQIGEQQLKWKQSGSRAAFNFLQQLFS